MNDKPNQLPILDCRGCGVCCLHMGYPAFNLPLNLLQDVADRKAVQPVGLGPAGLADLERWQHMPDERRQEVLEAVKNYNAPTDGELDQACIWLDPATRLCSHHTHRPQVCRDFEIGCDQCHDWRRHYHDLIQS